MASKRLIFFSGGVESSYMLMHADYNDLIIIVETAIFLGSGENSFHSVNTEKIVRAFGYDPIFFSGKIKLPAKGFIQQNQIFLGVANLLCLNDSQITEVWTGLNDTDYLGPERARALEAWKILHPSIPWYGPFRHMSKLQQWDEMPNDIKPLITTCIYNKKCGFCKKCKEFQELIVDKKRLSHYHDL